MFTKIIKTAEKLKKTISNCELSSKDAISYASQNDNEQEFLDNILKNKITVVDTNFSELYKIINDLAKEIVLVEDADTRLILLSVVLSTPDYAGLDKLADKALVSPKSIDDLKCVFFANDIFIEHVKITADKIINISKSKIN